MQALLQKEKDFQLKSNEIGATFANGKTLEEIVMKSVRQTLKETNENQTLAAKRLGIGCTTLWRILKKIES